MAKNPFVDGITNIAIPDSPYGVDLSGRTIKGNLYGIEAKVGGMLDLRSMNVGGRTVLTKMTVGEASLDYSHFGGQVLMDSIIVEGSLTLNEVVSNDYIYLEGAVVKHMKISGRSDYYIWASGLHVGGSLHLDDARIPFLDASRSPIVVDDSLFIGGAEIKEFRGLIYSRVVVRNNKTKIPDGLKSQLAHAPEAYKVYRAAFGAG